MNKKLIIATAGVLAILAPMAAMAAVSNTPITPPALPSTASTWELNNLIALVLNILWIVFIAFAIMMFIMAGISFLAAQGDPDKVGEARMFVLWGAVGIVVAILGFAMTAIVKNTTGL